MTIILSGSVVLKAGSNAPVLTENQYIELISGAEAFVNASSRYDWSANYATLPANTKAIVSNAVSSYAAISLINYNMEDYLGKFDAQVSLDVNWALFRECVNLLRDEKMRTFVQQGVVN